MKTLFLSHADIYSGNLILVNAKNPLRSSVSESSLMPLQREIEGVWMKSRVTVILQEIFEKLFCRGQIVGVSGYRSFLEQKRLYDNSVLVNGLEFTKKYVALPDHSEHQTGIAIDLAEYSSEIDFICPHFPFTGICQSFRRLAPKYGFIERYQKGKERITGIAHEPWHFRYVGFPHSAIMAEKGMAFEEYIALLKQFPHGEATLKYHIANGEIKVSYIAALPSKKIAVAVPEGERYQISGNNVDGFILTSWSCAAQSD